MFWDDDTAFAIEDRCPHLGFPLHQGTVEAGLVTCHWHHARFDLVSGCTLDLWADDARGFDVEIRGDDVFVRPRVHADPVGHLQTRLRNGLEDDISLVVAKSVLGLLDAGVPASEIVRTGVEFGTRYRSSGWGAGLTVLVAMANLLPQLDARRPGARARARAHVRRARHAQPRAALRGRRARDARRAGRPPRRAGTGASSTPARPTRPSARSRPRSPSRAASADVETMMFAAVTDHVFIDGGHTIDFTNKAFEAVEHLGKDAAGEILPTLVRQTTAASRSEEFGEWRHPHNHAALARRTIDALDGALADGPRRAAAQFADVGALGWQLLDDDPEVVAAALLDALRAGADEEQIGRAIAYAAALRIARFHVQNDHGDWDTVHHAFTAANGLHQALQRRPSPELLRGAVHAALRINLDRFLNVPAARLPHATSGSLDALAHCFDVQGMVDEAGQRGVRVPPRAAAPAPSSSPRSGTRCSPRTPSSTGTRRSKPGCARRSSGPKDRRRPRSCSPPSRASSPRTPGATRRLPPHVEDAGRDRRARRRAEQRLDRAEHVAADIGDPHRVYPSSSSSAAALRSTRRRRSAGAPTRCRFP